MQIPKTDQINIWKWVHALDSFEHADYALIAIIKNDAKDIKMFKNILTAFFVNYAKPFGNNRGIGSLDTDIISKEFIPYHKEILDYRHKFFAHSDLNAVSIKDNEFIDNMQIIIEDGRLNWQLRHYFPTTDQFNKYQYLLDKLITKCNYHINKLNTKYLSNIDWPDGKYHLNIRDESNLTFSKLEQKPI